MNGFANSQEFSNLVKDASVIVPLSRFAFIKTKFNQILKPLKPTEFIDLMESITPTTVCNDDNSQDISEVKEIYGNDKFHFELETICKKIVETKLKVKPINRPISKEDAALLKRIRKMEEEEENGIGAEVKEYALNLMDSTVVEHEDASGLIDDNMDYEMKNPTPLVVSAKIKQVTFDQTVIDKDELKSSKSKQSPGSSLSGVGYTTKSKKPEPPMIVKNTVIERSFSDSEDSGNNSDQSDVIEMEMIERDIVIAYHQKRQQLLASGLLSAQHAGVDGIDTDTMDEY